MPSFTQVIRPTLQTLRNLPTLHRVEENWGRIELKLETCDTRYWLTTEGVPHKTKGTPLNYVVDYVTIEKLTPEGHWDLRAVYSPDAWKLSQGFDYCQLLSSDLAALEARLDEHFSWETLKEIETLRRELDATNRALLELSERLRHSWK
jgi:hypothetical protein